MDRQQRNKLLGIASGELLVAAGIFLAVAIAGKTESNWQLGAVILCVLLAGVFQVVRRLGPQESSGKGQGKRNGKKKRKR